MNAPAPGDDHESEHCAPGDNHEKERRVRSVHSSSLSVWKCQDEEHCLLLYPPGHEITLVIWFKIHMTIER